MQRNPGIQAFTHRTLRWLWLAARCHRRAASPARFQATAAHGMSTGNMLTSIDGLSSGVTAAQTATDPTSLTPRQIAALNSKQIAAFSTSDIAGLTPAQIASLSPAGLLGLSQAQV